MKACPYCHKEYQTNNYKRHVDGCKSNPDYTPGICTNCNEEITGRKVKGLCFACYRYEHRYGIPRTPEIKHNHEEEALERIDRGIKDIKIIRIESKYVFNGIPKHRTNFKWDHKNKRWVPGEIIETIMLR